MCLIAFSWQPDADDPLILAANRDEYHSRPAIAAHWWPDAALFAGKDLQAGGTWLGISRGGRFAAITNIRGPHAHRPDALSRGKLVSDFLQTGISPSEYLADVVRRAERYNGFNLLVGAVGKTRSLCYLHSRDQAAQSLVAGVYGLSNRALDTPWPKVEKAKSALQAILQAKLSEEARQTALFTFLADPAVADDAALPDSGVGLERERLLSAACIVSPTYGTRCSTTLIVTRGAVRIEERTLSRQGAVVGAVVASVRHDV